jgi:hypothetical protein
VTEWPFREFGIFRALKIPKHLFRPWRRPGAEGPGVGAPRGRRLQLRGRTVIDSKSCHQD